MKKYQNQHDFCLGHGGISVILTLCGRWKSIFCHHCIKKLAKIICHTKYFNNFVFGDYSDYCSYLFVFQPGDDQTQSPGMVIETVFQFTNTLAV